MKPVYCINYGDKVIETNSTISNPVEKVQVAFEHLIFGFLLLYHPHCFINSEFEIELAFNDNSKALKFSAALDLETCKIIVQNNSLMLLGKFAEVVEQCLNELYGPELKKPSDIITNEDSVRWLIKAVRNAFAHDPIVPKWYFLKGNGKIGEIYPRKWVVELLNGTVIKVDLTNKHDEILRLEDFGQKSGLIELLLKGKDMIEKWKNK
jgi:hypothetical protein